MKRILFAILFSLVISCEPVLTFSQNLTITQGDNKLVSQYTGADPTEITYAAATSGKWYELIVITGTSITSLGTTEIKSQHWGGTVNDPSSGWRQAGATSTVKFLFNASAGDDIVERSIQSGWLITPGIYQFFVREYYNTEPIQSIDIEIVGEATTAIQAATVAFKKARGKK